MQRRSGGGGNWGVRSANGAVLTAGLNALLAFIPAAAGPVRPKGPTVSTSENLETSRSGEPSTGIRGRASGCQSVVLAGYLVPDQARFCSAPRCEC